MKSETEIKCQKLGFLLLDNFTMIAFASAIDPLRMANQLSSEKLYEWVTFSDNGEPVKSSDGIIVSVDKAISQRAELDALIVVGGVNITQSYIPAHLSWLKQQNNLGVRMGGICTGSYVLAAAGLLDGRECSIHWEYAACLSETFPKVINNNYLYTLSKDRISSSGGIAPLDMMMALIQQQHGAKLTAGISDMFTHDRVRSEQDFQRIPMRHSLANAQPKLKELVSLMENNLEEPISLNELASYINISRRQLERVFQKYFNSTPSRYYLRLRLERARQLLKQTSLSIIEVATACGFVSTPHFSKCYRDYTGMPPRDERSATRIQFGNSNRSIPTATRIVTGSVADAIENEPSYGSVAIAAKS